MASAVLSNSFLRDGVWQSEIENVFASAGVGISGVVEGSQFTGEFFENLQHAIEVLVGVCGHETRANDGLAVTNGWVDCGCGKNSLFKEALGKDEGLRLAADEDGNDRGLRRADLEANALETLVHLAGVFPKLIDAPGLFLHEFEGFFNASDDRWS